MIEPIIHEDFSLAAKEEKTSYYFSSEIPERTLSLNYRLMPKPIPPPEPLEKTKEEFAATSEPTPLYFCSNTSNLLTLVTAPVSEKELPARKLVHDCAQKIKAIFPEKIQWSDLPVMMRISLQYLDNFLELTSGEKRSFVVQVLDHTMDITLSHYLPFSFERTLFKAMIPPLVNILIPDSFDKYFPVIKKSSLPDESIVWEAATNIRKEFTAGFQWEDLGSVICLSVQFANHYENLPNNQKSDVAKQIVKHVIDHTPTPHLPDSFAHSIFEMIANSLIDELFAKL